MDANTSCLFAAGTSGNAEDMAAWWIQGNVIEYSSGGAFGDTGLRAPLAQWNTIQLTHTNGTGNWSMAVNGGTPVVLATDTRSAESGIYKGMEWENQGGTAPTASYIDGGVPAATPEPSTLALLATGLTALLAYAWRKRR